MIISVPVHDDTNMASLGLILQWALFGNGLELIRGCWEWLVGLFTADLLFSSKTIQQQEQQLKSNHSNLNI